MNGLRKKITSDQMNNNILYILLLFCCTSNPSQSSDFNIFDLSNVQSKIILSYEHWLKQIGAKLIEENPKIQFWMSFHQDPFANGVISSQYDNNQELVDAINAVKKIGQESHVPITWWVDPCTKPNNTAHILKENGFAFHDSFEIMVYQLDKSINDFSVNPEIHIKRIINKNETNNWTHVLSSVYAYDVALASASINSIDWNDIDLNDDHIFAGYFQNKLVSTGTLFIQDDWAELASIATISEARNKGVATALILGMLHYAQQLGLKYIVLMATSAGKNIYAKLGFKKVYELEMYKFDDGILK